MRSARNWTDLQSVAITMSGAVLPEPPEWSGSSLVAWVIYTLLTLNESQLSLTLEMKSAGVNVSYLWSGGDIEGMFPLKVIVGGSLSTTVTVCAHDEWLPELSVAVQVIVVVPFGYSAINDWLSLRVPVMLGLLSQLSVAVAVPTT